MFPSIGIPFTFMMAVAALTLALFLRPRVTTVMVWLLFLGVSIAIRFNAIESTAIPPNNTSWLMPFFFAIPAEIETLAWLMGIALVIGIVLGGLPGGTARLIAWKGKSDVRVTFACGFWGSLLAYCVGGCGMALIQPLFFTRKQDEDTMVWILVALGIVFFLSSLAGYVLGCIWGARMSRQRGG